MGRLIFHGGVCVKEIDGAAINDVPESIEVERPESLAGADIDRLVLTEEDVVVREETPEEIAVREAAVLDAKVQRLAVRVLHNHENRIRILEGKQEISIAQIRDALKTLLSL